jgi:hypothetical protein
MIFGWRASPRQLFFILFLSHEIVQRLVGPRCGRSGRPLEPLGDP